MTQTLRYMLGDKYFSCCCKTLKRLTGKESLQSLKKSPNNTFHLFLINEG